MLITHRDPKRMGYFIEPSTRELPFVAARGKLCCRSSETGLFDGDSVPFEALSLLVIMGSKAELDSSGERGKASRRQWERVEEAVGTC